MSQRESSLTYADTGVDVEIEAKAARILFEASKKTWVNREGNLGEIIIPFNDFSGLRYIKVDSLPPGTVMSGGSDGTATKAAIVERSGQYDSAAFDLIAMTCDDAVIRGGEPILVKSVLEVNTLGRYDDRLPIIAELAKGYVAGAKEANVAILNGEIAQLNDRFRPSDKFMFNWSGDVTWFGNESRLLTGFAVVPGDLLIGFEEPGLRCNGISLVRTVLKAVHGEQWETVEIGGEKLIDQALRPSRIYTKALVDIFGGWNLNRQPKAILHAAAHITGGGIPHKLGRALRPSGFGAVIEDPFTPSPLMTYCQQIGSISDREAYRTWNMGQGMIVIAPSADKVIKVAGEYNIKAKVIGQVTEEPRIVIKSQGLENITLHF